MSVRGFIASNVMAHLLSENRQAHRRHKAERQRQRARAPHRIDYFHQADDPYAHLTAQALPKLARDYAVDIRPHLVSAPPDWAAPERARLIDYSRRDAGHLAERTGLSFIDPGHQPASDHCIAAEHALAEAIETGRFAEQAVEIGTALWAGTLSPMAHATEYVSTLKADGDAMRHKLGHYLPATFHYGGEWYWGLDRLHYLERRLQDLGALKNPQHGPAFPPADDFIPVSPAAVSPPAEIHFYLSFRSPYTYIVAARIKALADAYGATLHLRYVLPMVMRSLPVPRMKGFYIMSDVAREARRLGIPFGRVVDPVGRPVERGYALLPWAISQNLGYEYCESFLRGVWSEGIDAGTDAGLKKIVTRIGLEWSEARALIGNDDWRPQAEINRQELLDLGLWGVPSFRVGPVSTWGQDRLWVIDRALQDYAAGVR